MNIELAKKLSLDELREAYRAFLESCGLNKNTIQTSSNDAFYLWKNGSEELFWTVLLDSDFETRAKKELITIFSALSKGDPNKLVSGYMSHLRKLKRFVFDGELTSVVTTERQTVPRRKKVSIDVPTPCIEQVEHYLAQWDALENYHLQEDALNRLFFTLCPLNDNISDILVKVATLNDFYSTNIFSVYPVAKHILSLNIDARLNSGDPTLVDDIQKVTINGVEKHFYSFATKYCSHHKSLEFPIYDSYVEKVLLYFRDRDGFYDFGSGDLKNYVAFKNMLIEFRKFYKLEQYDLKQIDKYIWQLGKEFFPKNYGGKSAKDGGENQ